MNNRHIWWKEPSNVLLITGQSNTGKSKFLLQILVEAMMPQKFAGKNLNVIFLETRINVKTNHIIERIAQQIRKADPKIAEVEIQKMAIDIIEEKLRIYRVYDREKFKKFMEFLETNLEVRKGFNMSSVFILDCLGSFYWDYCDTVEQTRRLEYIKHVFKDLFKICLSYNCPFVAGCRMDKNLELDVDSIYLEVNQNGTYKAHLQQKGAIKIHSYQITENELKLID